MVDLQRLKPLYQELQGYLAQAPPEGDRDNWQTGDEYCDPFNSVVKEVIEITADESYSRFHYYEKATGSFEASVYRTKLNGMIAHLHANYFQVDPMPFSGGEQSTSMLIQQTQTQSQEAYISLTLDLQEQILAQLTEGALEDNEKGFLEKIKDGLRQTTSLMKLLHLILTAALEFDVGLQRLLELLKI